MAPNGGSGIALSYENEDVASLPSFEKRGEFVKSKYQYK